MKKIAITFATIALAVASAASKAYNVTISEPTTVNGTQVKPGDYKLQVEGDKAILKSGKNVVAESPAKVENADHKFDTTQVSIDTANNQSKVNEIRIGGTTMRVVFPGSSAAGQE